MKSDPFFRKQPELHDPCPVVPPREASIRSLAARAYHTQARHLTLDPGKQQALTLGHGGLSSSSGASGTATLPQRTLTMPGPLSQSAASAAAAAAASSSSSAVSGAAGGGGAGSGSNPAAASAAKVGGSRDSLLESSSSGLGRLQKQGAGAYSKSYTLV